MLPTIEKPTSNYAVVINSNAGRVTERLTNELKRIVPKDRLFLTKSQLHARDVIEHCVEQRVQAVYAGGGDGTIVDVINNGAVAFGRIFYSGSVFDCV